MLSLAMTEIGYVVLQLLDVLFPGTAIMERHWKSFGAVLMEHTMPVRNCMVLFAVLVLRWDMIGSLHTRWNQKTEHLSEHQDSDLMGKLAGNSGQDPEEENIMSALMS